MLANLCSCQFRLTRSSSYFRQAATYAALATVVIASGCNSAPSGDHASPLPVKSRESKISDPYYVELTGSREGWTARYRDSSRKDTLGPSIPADHQLLVPLNTTIVLTLKSTDYIYSLSIPKFGVKEVAVPNLEFQMRFRPTKSGRFELEGDELCGDPHVAMPTNLLVLPQHRFAKWLSNKS
jgi:heme/copper-type cytochrome/quinol oxidase subunit 2